MYRCILHNIYVHIIESSSYTAHTTVYMYIIIINYLFNYNYIALYTKHPNIVKHFPIYLILKRIGIYAPQCYLVLPKQAKLNITSNIQKNVHVHI